MLKYILLLSLLGLSHGRPKYGDLHEPHEDCPDDRHLLLPHEYDCTKFYYCEYGLKRIDSTDCAPGTEFSTELQVCVDPITANCTLPGFTTTEHPTDEIENGTQSTSGPTTTTVSTTNSTEAPINTTTIVPSTITTVAPTTNLTEAPINSTTVSPTTVTTVAPTTNLTEAPINSTTAEPTTITTEAPTTNLTEAPINTTTVAPTTITTEAPTTNSTEVPVNTTIVAPTTTTTLTPTTNSTEAPVNTTTVAPTTVTTVSPTTNSTEAPVNATTVAPTTTKIPTTQPDELEYLDNGCPADFDVHKLLPHETSCDKFYYCVRGELVERNCSTGTYFNPVIQVCDWPQNVNCTNEGDYEEDEDDVVEGGSPDPEEEDEAPEEGELLPNGCPADFDVHKLISHETDCDKYYYCVFGDLVERTCSPGTHFNYEIQVCDWPQNVNCTLGGNGNGTVNPDGDDNGNSTVSPDGNGNGNGSVNPDGNGTVNPDGNDNSTESPGGDSGSGDNGDEDSDALLPNGCPVDYDVHQLLPHETDCNKFYYCVAGEKIETQCANDTHFNPELKVCDWPWNAGCEIGEGSGDGDDNGTGDGDSGNGDNGDGDNGDGDNGNGDNGNGDNGDGDNGDGDNGNGDNGNGDNGTGDSGNGDNGDGDNGEGDNGNGDNGNGDNGTGDGDNNGNGDGDNGVTNKCEVNCNVLPWKHETDCDKYWICDGNTPTLIVCSEGLHFNPNTYSCDFICNANCVREDIQSTPGVDGVKLFLPWDKIDSTSLKYLLNKIQH